MKTILAFLVIVVCLFASAAEPKRPLGVPADAKHFNGRWYKVVYEKRSWHSARDKCKEMGGQLCIVPDAATWEFVKTLTTASVWLGASDEEVEGVWKWVDGTPVKFSDWFGAGPDNARGIENWLSTYKSQWNDAPKNGEFIPGNFVVGYICEWAGR